MFLRLSLVYLAVIVRDLARWQVEVRISVDLDLLPAGTLNLAEAAGK